MTHPKYIFDDNDMDRFWSLVDRIGGEDACWLWIGKSFHTFGYGLFRLPSLQNWVHAHRFLYFVTNGDIPNGLFVCHNCPTGDNPRCVNPRHMFLGTSGDNARDRERKGRHPHPPTWAGIGELNPKAKMTDRLVVEARTRYAHGGISQAQLGREYGMSQAMMNKIILSRHWSHLPSVDELRVKAG